MRWSLTLSRTVIAALAATVLLGSGQTAAAQQKRQKRWSPTLRTQVDVRYDDNPFLQTSGQKRRLEEVSPADSQSGRFRDMESATDLVPTPALELGLDGPGLGGRSLDISADVAYEANLENARRRHTELGLTVAQSLPSDARLRFDLGWRPSYFHKNYLNDAVDLNADDEIGPEERVYETGTSSELDAWLGYRHRLQKSLRAELEVGYFDRTYDAPFAGRSRRGPGAGAELALALGRRWTLGLGYTYQSLSDDPTVEVLILDENAFGVDFNGNGTVSEDSARAAVSVDHSRTDQEIALTIEGELGRMATLAVSFGRRRRNFSSEEPYDVAHRDRSDARNEIAAELDARLATGFHLMLGGRRTNQTTNRAGDPGSTGEETDYTRYVLWAGLRYRF
ncbi:MAG: hypothetical protein ACREMV_06415 [Gemmatimonadales bacterium]